MRSPRAGPQSPARFGFPNTRQHSLSRGASSGNGSGSGTRPWMKKAGRDRQGSRVVLRSYNNANTNGGVAYVNANNDSSNTNTNNGSRLDNRKVKKRRSQPKDEKDAVPA